MRAGFAAAERHGADHVVAGDVIAALPDGPRASALDCARVNIVRAMAKTVGEIMDTDPETVSPDTDVESVIRMLREQRAARACRW